MRIQQQNTHGLNAGGILEIFIAKSGVLSARIQRPQGVLHLHSAVKPEDESAWYERTEFWGDLIVFLGTGLGYHVAPLVKAIPPGASILLVDYYPRCIDHCRKKVFAPLINNIISISPDDPDWRNSAARVSRGGPLIQIVKHPASYAANKVFYDSVLDALILRRKHKKEEKKALLFFGNFFLEEELRRALAKEGPPPALFNYNNCGPSGGARYETTLYKLIQKERPAFILSVNMKGFDGRGIVCDTAYRLGIPVATWFVDDPHPIMLQQRPFVKDHMTAFTWERSFVPWLSDKGFAVVRYLPLAADPSLFERAAPKGPQTEVGFVGSSMGRNFLDTLASQFMWRQDLEPVVNCAARGLLADRKTSVPRLVDEACRAAGITLPFTDEKNTTWFCSYIIHTASMLLRKELVAACIPRGIRTFGDPEGWRGLLGDALPTSPDIDYRSDIANVYRGITVNINITSCQMATAVNQRVFDIPLCNGFVLCDHQSDLDELFAPDEIAVYKSKEELAAKIDYFLAHEPDRSAIARKARAHILAGHTYAHRIAEIRKNLP